jgi:hypothetical protein
MKVRTAFPTGSLGNERHSYSAVSNSNADVAVCLQETPRANDRVVTLVIPTMPENARTE